MLNSIRVRSFIANLPYFVLVCATIVLAQSPQSQPGPASRIAGPIDDLQVVTLTGNVHPLARPDYDRGPLPPQTELPQLVLHIDPSPAQQAELDALVEAQHDPASPLFHKWLTPAQYGERFGASAPDLARIAAWLTGHGFAVQQVAASNRLIVFSGTAGQVEETFHTEMHRYLVNGVEHIANMQDPQIPAALAPVVGGVLSLHDFRRQSQIASKTALAPQAPQSLLHGSQLRSGADTPDRAAPQYTSGATHYLFPADWATIYDLNSLYGSGKNGSGASIAIVGRSNINLSDVAGFRSLSGLPANNPTVILVGANPGLVSGDQDEATLDVEWSGATAPGATIKFVVGASTATTDGVDLSAQYIVNHALAPVMSTSYGSCEQDMGATELSFYNALWQQAASEGISAFVSSGDSGAAGCDGGSSATGTVAAVNGLCSSPYSTCVGGTEFNDESNATQFWSATNSSTYGSALGYIPEKVWNESALDGGSGLWASTGGLSKIYTQPSWQKGVSGAGAGMRAVPDVAMAAAGHDGYIIEEDGSDYVIAGTSAASPSLAGVMALVVQSDGGSGQGNANPQLYALLNASKNPFHATPSGNNSVPGVAGFTASGAAYNLATGLGSVDGALLVAAWGQGSVSNPSTPNFALTQSSASGSALAGKAITFSVGVTESGSAKNAIALSVKAPAGVTASLSPASILPGALATVTLNIAASAALGTQTVTVTGADSSGTLALSYALTVTAAPTLALTLASSTASVTQGAVEHLSLTASTGGPFTGAITWSVSGLPSGVTASWSANPMTPAASTSSNVETLALTASANAAITSTPITITAAGDGLAVSKQCTLQVTKPAGVTLAVSSAKVAVQSLGSIQVAVTATPTGGLISHGPTGTGAPAIAVTAGLPNGFTAVWSAPNVTSAGPVVWNLTLTGSAKAIASSSTLTLTAVITSATTGAPYTATATLPMTVTLSPPTLAVSASSASLTLAPGKTARQAVALAGNATFTGAVTLSLSSLPAGVTAAWSSNPLNLTAGAGASTLTLTAASSAKQGSTTMTITAKGDGLTITKQFTLQLTSSTGQVAKF